AGVTGLAKHNGLSGQDTQAVAPNLGIEQTLLEGKLALRAGLDESTLGGGFTVRFSVLKLDVVYLRDLGVARLGTFFGAASDSVIASLSLDYAKLVEGSLGAKAVR